MVDTVNEFQQIFLSYKDVSEANPDWSDQMVEDYLATKRDITAATETADKAVDTSSASVLIPAIIQRLEALENVQHPKFGQIALDQIDKGSLKVREISADYTTEGNQILICNNLDEILITLNPLPEHKEQVVIVRNGKGRVNVTSNKTISGKVTKKILRQYTAPHHIYTTEADAWNVI